MNNPLIIIPAYIDNNDHCKLLAQTIKTIDQTVNDPDVVIVDDGSVQDERTVLFYDETKEKFPFVWVIEQKENSGFATTVNRGLRVCEDQKRDAVLVNADIEFTKIGWLNTMFKSEGDIVGAKLLYPEGYIQHAGTYFSGLTRSFEHRYVGAPSDFDKVNEQAYCPVTAALQYIRWTVLDTIGLYDEDFKMGFEDVDYCIRALQQGFKCVYNPRIEAIHHEHAFRGKASEKVKNWEKESYKTLVIKYADTDFAELMERF